MRSPFDMLYLGAATRQRSNAGNTKNNKKSRLGHFGLSLCEIVKKKFIFSMRKKFIGLHLLITVMWKKGDLTFYSIAHYCMQRLVAMFSFQR